MIQKENNYVWGIDRDTYDAMIINGHDLSKINYQQPLSIKTNGGEIIYTTKLGWICLWCF